MTGVNLSTTRSGVLVVSAWIEDGDAPQLRARLTADPVTQRPVTLYEGSIDDVVEGVRRWLEYLVASAEGS